MSGNRLDVVLELARRDEQTEAGKLARLNKHLDDQRRRREQLIEYGAEYRARIASDARRGINAHTYREHAAFIQHIQTSIDGQARTFSVLESRVEQQRQRWAEARTRVKSLERAIEKAAREKAARRERHAQLAADEWSQTRRIATEAD